MMSRAVLTVVAGCMVVAVGSFFAVYTMVAAFTDETWPEL